jgi:hypothetical protein
MSRKSHAKAAPTKTDKTKTSGKTGSLIRALTSARLRLTRVRPAAQRSTLSPVLQ